MESSQQNRQIRKISKSSAYAVSILLTTLYCFPSQAIEHVARRGDNLSQILKTYGITPSWGPGSSVDRLLKANDEMLQKFPGQIEIGQVIIVPDDLIADAGNVSSNDVGIKVTSRNGTPVQIIDSRQVQTAEDSDLEKAQKALTESLSQDEKDFINNTGTRSEVQQVAAPPEPAESEAPSMVAIEENRSNDKVSESIESSKNSESSPSDSHREEKVSQSGIHLFARPQLNRLQFYRQASGQKTSLKDADGQGISLGTQLQMTENFFTGFEYTYREATFHPKSGETLVRKSQTYQNIQGQWGYQFMSFFRSAFSVGMAETLNLFVNRFDQNELQSTWQPFLGLELGFSGQFPSKSTSWHIQAGTQQLFGQRVGELEILQGNRSFLELGIGTQAHPEAFIRFDLGFERTDQRYSTGQQVMDNNYGQVTIQTQL